MILGVSALTQALLGTLVTWGLTAAGSAVVFLLPGTKVLEGLVSVLLYCPQSNVVNFYTNFVIVYYK